MEPHLNMRQFTVLICIHLFWTTFAASMRRVVCCCSCQHSVSLGVWPTIFFLVASLRARRQEQDGSSRASAVCLSEPRCIRAGSTSHTEIHARSVEPEIVLLDIEFLTTPKLNLYNQAKPESSKRFLVRESKLLDYQSPIPPWDSIGGPRLNGPVLG